MGGMTCWRPIRSEVLATDEVHFPEKSQADHFATLSREASGVATDGIATDFAGGHVASRRSSAPDSPSLENFTTCGRRCPSGVCQISENSNCARPASDCSAARSIRKPQNSDPGNFDRAGVRNSGFGPPFDIDTVARLALATALRWKS